MYKIYINNNPLILLSENDYKENVELAKGTQCFRFNRKMISSYVDMLEKSKNTTVIIYGNELKQLKTSFFSYFNKIRAAGGLVTNEYNEILMIFRNDVWDLPKGKIDPGEGKRKAALREVSEETGVTGLKIESKLLKTYHVYKLEGEKKRILKVTHWYKMVAQKQKTRPELAENIEKVEWVEKNNILNLYKSNFKNVLLVIDKYLKD